MKQHSQLKKLAYLFSFLFIHSCSSVPITGRNQLIILPESQMISMSLNSYGDFLNTNKVSENIENTQLVKETGARISTAVEQFLSDNGMSSKLKGFKWEFNLIADQTPNAWCMPGGKVVFYEGILPYTKNADGLAVVMGHEIAHAVARHGNERFSQQLIIQAGSTAAAYTLLQDKPESTRILLSTAIGIGSNVGITLPFSRKHEYEADKLGLIFMAMAGYNPKEAIDFWTRMSKIGGEKPPEFLSTHPSDEKRIEHMKQIMPEVMKYYKPYSNKQ